MHNPLFLAAALALPISLVGASGIVLAQPAPSSPAAPPQAQAPVPPQAQPPVPPPPGPGPRGPGMGGPGMGGPGMSGPGMGGPGGQGMEGPRMGGGPGMGGPGMHAPGMMEGYGPMRGAHRGPPPSRAASFHFQRDDSEIHIHCAEGESTRACVDAASILLDKLAAIPAR